MSRWRQSKNVWVIAGQGNNGADALAVVTYNGMTFVPYIKESTIQGRITEIAAQITNDYSGLRPLFLCVLTGAFPFAADLFRSVGIDAEISFIRLKSYEGTSTTGKVKEESEAYNKF